MFSFRKDEEHLRRNAKKARIPQRIGVQNGSVSTTDRSPQRIGLHNGSVSTTDRFTCYSRLYLLWFANYNWIERVARYTEMIRDEFTERMVGYCSGRSLFIVECELIMIHDSCFFSTAIGWSLFSDRPFHQSLMSSRFFFLFLDSWRGMFSPIQYLFIFPYKSNFMIRSIWRNLVLIFYDYEQQLEIELPDNLCLT